MGIESTNLEEILVQDMINEKKNLTDRGLSPEDVASVKDSKSKFNVEKFPQLSRRPSLTHVHVFVWFRSEHPYRPDGKEPNVVKVWARDDPATRTNFS